MFSAVFGAVGLITILVLACIVPIFIRVINPWEKAVIETLGRFVGVRGSGLCVVIPVFQQLTKIDMRELVCDVPPQQVITADNVLVQVDAVVYLQIIDPVRLRYNVADFWDALQNLARTNIRNVVGEITLDRSLTSRDVINDRLRESLAEATAKWGAAVNRVEIQRIDPPADVTAAMHRQMKAERERRAMILEAEGEKQSLILKADGQKEAAIRQAQGDAEAQCRLAEAARYRREMEAEAEAVAIERTFSAIHQGTADSGVLTYCYLEALKEMARGPASKIVIPYETASLIGSVAALGALGGQNNVSTKG